MGQPLGGFFAPFWWSACMGQPLGISARRAAVVDAHAAAAQLAANRATLMARGFLSSGAAEGRGHGERRLDGSPQ
jgi:hypothetical protein